MKQDNNISSQRPKFVGVRFSEEELDSLQSRAGENGMNLSQVIRYLLFKSKKSALDGKISDENSEQIQQEILTDCRNLVKKNGAKIKEISDALQAAVPLKNRQGDPVLTERYLGRFVSNIQALYGEIIAALNRISIPKNDSFSTISKKQSQPDKKEKSGHVLRGYSTDTPSDGNAKLHYSWSVSAVGEVVGIIDERAVGNGLHAITFRMVIRQYFQGVLKEYVFDVEALKKIVMEAGVAKGAKVRVTGTQAIKEKAETGEVRLYIYAEKIETV